MLVLFTSLVTACSPQEKIDPAAAWAYADLRMLSNPEQDSGAGDFIAGYARSAGSDLQLRFDFLDITGYPEDDYYVALDYEPGGSHALPIEASTDIAWDSLLVLPAQGIPQLLSPASFDDFADELPVSAQFTDPGVPIPRIVRNPWQDFILVSITQAFLPNLSHGINIQAFSREPGMSGARDAIGPFNSRALPPQRAPVLLTFWDTFPAFSPAQALRKWDGAHTGPYGERHGLAILLESIRKFSVPAALLDLRNPASLSALDHLGGLPLVNALLDNKLLILPDSLPGSPSFPIFPDGLPAEAQAYYLDQANEISSQFEIPPSDSLFIPRNMPLVPGYSSYFTPASQTSQFPPQIPLPPQSAYEAQADPDGLSLSIRRILLMNALERTADPGRFPLLMLGGSLQDSAFGDPSASPAALSYIANHPWIDPLNMDDLRALPGDTEFQILPGTTRASDAGQFSPSPSLARLPEPDSSNPLIGAAWDSAFSLYSTLPPGAETLAQLRAAYSGQPGILAAAGEWGTAAYTARDCGVDLDYDGFPECILASENQFAVIDPLGARLIAYFYRDNTGLHQVVAPTSQFIVGLGDPSTWLLEAVDGADPAGIHGAFADSPPPWPLYSYSTAGDGISFTSPDQQVEKNFALRDAGLSVNYSQQNGITSRIPIAIDPWTRFSPGWSTKLAYSPIENGFQFSQEENVVLEVIADIPLQAYSFSDSANLLGVPEDPNHDYPPGHYLPFPITVLEFNSPGDFNLHILPAWQSGE